jgi:AraC family transcriptional activator of pobA
LKPAQSASRKAVPSVDFYGKDDAWPLSEPLHSELLIDRSAQHNWVIRAHRHSNQTQIFLLLEGSGSARLDTVRHAAVAPSVIIIPDRCVHEFEWSSNCGGFVLSISSSEISELKRKSERFKEVLATPAVYALGAEASALRDILGSIHAEYAKDHPLRELALEAQLIAMTVCLCRLAKIETDTINKSGRGGRHFRRFIELVERQHKFQWSVARYADSLGITPSHLNSICKEYDGRSALQVIHQRLLLAARRGLSHTDVSIAGVARDLGFADPSYFTRFFRRFEGITPGQFRRQTGTQSVSNR